MTGITYRADGRVKVSEPKFLLRGVRAPMYVCVCHAVTENEVNAEVAPAHAGRYIGERGCGTASGMCHENWCGLPMPASRVTGVSVEVAERPRPSLAAVQMAGQ
jgi:bacterioferritin-associated ferredoxin